MQVEFGNVAAKNADGSPAGLGAPSVTYLHIPDEYEDEHGNRHYSMEEDVDTAAFKAHLGDAALSGNGVTRLGDVFGHNAEALLVATHPAGAWNSHSSAKPSWVWSDNEHMQKFLSEFYGCPAGKPDGVSDTHFDKFGPPGYGPHLPNIQALLVNSGRDMWAQLLGGGASTGDSGTSTGTSGTTLQDTGKAWTTNQWTGYRVSAAGVYGVVLSNTATTLTIDRWSNPATPGGAAGSTPGAISAYQINPGGAPAMFVGLTANSGAPAAGDTSLSGEITTASGGLVRKIAPWAHTAGTNTYTLTPVYTANGSDTLPVTVAKIGVFSSMVVAAVTQTMMFETLFSATATLSSSGDQLTVTETVTGS